MALTRKQQRFVSEYLVDLNATRAAIRAGYSAKNADKIGSQLLGKTRVADAVASGQSKRLSKLDISAERVLSELARIGFSDVRAWFDADGRLRPLTDLTDDAARVVASVEVLREKTRKVGNGNGYTIEEAVVKVRAWDKVRALELLAKNLGLLKDRLQIEGMPGLRIVRDDNGK